MSAAPPAVPSPSPVTSSSCRPGVTGTDSEPSSCRVMLMGGDYPSGWDLHRRGPASLGPPPGRCDECHSVMTLYRGILVSLVDAVPPGSTGGTSTSYPPFAASVPEATVT